MRIVLLLALALAACAPAAKPTAIPQTQTPTAAPAETPIPTPTVVLPTEPPPTETPPPSATLEPTATAKPRAALPPTPIPLPVPTRDPQAARYLQGVERMLRHSARVVTERALGLGHVCDERYFVAFPYREPDYRQGMTFIVVALARAPDGTIREGEHIRIWHLGDEGLFTCVWNNIFLTDRSTEGLLRIEFLLQEPAGDGWRVGMASAACPGDDLRMVGIFPVSHPDDYALLSTRYNAQAPLDFWLQDGDQLRRYHWEPWTDTLLWTLEETPGRLVAVEWTEDAPDLTGDGLPDLVMDWDVSGETVRWVYAADGDAFVPVGPADSE